MNLSANDSLMLVQVSLDHMDEGLAIFDADLCLVRWNKSFVQRFEYPKRLIKTGTSVKQLIRFNAERGIYGEGDAQAIAEDRFQMFSERIRRSYLRAMPDGTFIQANWYPLPDGGMVLVYRDITEQRRTEDTLRRQAEIIQGIHEAIFVNDEAGIVTGWNRAAERLWGYTREEVEGKHRSFLIAPGEGYTPESEIHRQIEAEGHFENEIRCIKKDGEEFITSVTVSLLEEGHNGHQRFATFARDITARKRAEAEAVSMQYRFEAFMANSPVAAFIKDAEGRLIYVNKIYEDTLGSNLRHRLEEKSSDPLCEETTQELSDHDIKVLATGKPMVVEERIDTGDGVKIFLVSKFSIVSETGERLLGGLALDLTETKKTEQALRESEARLRGIHENTSDGIFTISEVGIIETTNQAAEEMFGYGPGELIGKDVAMLMGGDHKVNHQAYIEKYMETGRGQILGVGPRELTGIRKDGSEFALDLAVNVMKMDDRRIFVGVLRDITDRKEARQQLQQAQKMEAIGQLTGGIAHDFNNMLAIVLGNLELAVERAAEGRDVGKLLNLALDGATRGSDLTKRLLAFSRQQFLEPRLVDINDMIGEMADILHRTIGEGVEIAMEPGSDIWGTKIDPIQLQSAVLNLAINGRDAMPEGGRLQITTANKVIKEDSSTSHLGLQPGEYVVVSVKDNGTGIRDDDMEHIFEPFFTTKEIGKGSGLGLSMVHGFAEQSGGRAIAKSKLGEGTEILIYLPRCHPMEDAEAATREIEKTTAANVSVLLVEDDQEVRVLVAEYLRAMSYRVIEAKDGAGADDILRDEPQINLLLTDMVLPGGVGGPEIARRVREQIPEVKVLYMSGYAAHSMLHGQTIEESASLIQKPFRRRELQTAISEILSL